MTTITIKAADYSARAIGFAMPVDGGVYGNFFGLGSDPSRNLINPNAPGALVGVPSLVADGIQCNGSSSHVITPYAPSGLSDAWTIMAAYQFAETSAFAPVVSNFSTADNNGACLLANRGAVDGVFRTAGSFGVTNASGKAMYDVMPPNEAETPSKVAIAALSYTPNESLDRRFTLHVPQSMWSGNTITQTAPVAAINDPAALAFRVGAHRPSSGGNFANTIRAAFIFNRTLDTVEVLTLGRWLAGYYQRRGYQA